MRHKILSDHTQDQLQLAKSAKRTVRFSEYLKDKSLEWQKNGRYFLYLLSLFIRLFYWLFTVLFGLRGKTAEEQILEAGNQGEQLVTNKLHGILSDDWILLDGYRNRKGETDKVLIGPKGVLMIEIKNINGTVYIDGDSWKRDKYDKYGNLKETGLPIADKYGRSPSQQVNDVANSFERFLSSQRNINIKITRAVIFTHRMSCIDEIENLTIDMVYTIDHWNVEETIQNMNNLPKGVSAQKIENLLLKDHAFHN